MSTIIRSFDVVLPVPPQELHALVRTLPLPPQTGHGCIVLKAPRLSVLLPEPLQA